MNKNYFIPLIALILIISAASVFATAPTITVIQPNGGENFKENYSVEFTVQDLEGDISLANLFYDADGVVGGETSIETVDLTANCDDTNFMELSTCHYDWDTTGIDGDYYFYIKVTDTTPETGEDFSDAIFTVDNTAPATITNLAATAVSSSKNIDLSWDASVETDFANYKLYRSTAEITEANKASATLVTTITEQTTATYTDSGTDCGTTYYYAITATDITGNESALSSNDDAATNDVCAPTGASISVADYTNNASVSLTLNASGATKMKVRCNDADWNSTSETTYQGSYSFNITSGLGCNGDQGTKTIYARFGDDAGNWTGTVSDSTIYDTSSPSTPTINSPSISGDDATISWNSISDTSGIKRYWVRLDSDSWIDNGTSTSRAFNNLSNGSHTIYVKAEDNVGYQSGEDSESFSISSNSGTCNYDITIDAPDYAGTSESITITITSSDDMEDADIYLYTESKDITIKSNYDGDTVTYNYTFKSADEGTATVSVIVDDEDGDSCNESKDIEIDTAKPGASWRNPTEGATLTEKIGLIVLASDADSGIKVVNLFYAKKGTDIWEKITGLSASYAGNEYRYSWIIPKTLSGEYELKLSALDNAKNQSNDSIIDVTIGGEAADTSAIQASIDSAKEKQIAVNDLVNYLKEFNAKLNSEMQTKLNNANSALSNAETQLEAKELGDANSSALNAIKLFDEINAGIAITVYSTKDYEFNADELETLVNASGLASLKASEAIALMEENSVKRQLQIVKIVMGSKTFYQANIVLTVKNNSSETETVNVIEVIPKEFAENSSNLSSINSFTVIQSDPIIEWSISLNAGQEKEIIYSLKTELTKAEADAMVSDNIVSKYASMPVLLNKSTELAAEDFGEQTIITSNATGFAIFEGVPLAQTLGIIIVIIVVIVVIVLLVQKTREGGHSLAAEEGFWGKLKGKKEEKQKGGKWSFKE